MVVVEGRWNAAFSFNRKGRYPMNFFEKELRNLFGSSPMLRDATIAGGPAWPNWTRICG